MERIVSRGWLERRADPEDRRRVLLRVTEEGEQVLHALEGPPRQARARLLDGLEVDELEDLARLVARLLDVARDPGAGQGAEGSSEDPARRRAGGVP